MNKHSYKYPKRKAKKQPVGTEIYSMGIIAFFCAILPFSVIFPASAEVQSELPVAASVVAQEEPKLTELPQVPFERNGITWTYVGPARDHSVRQKDTSTGLTQAKKDSVAVQCELAKTRNGWNEKDKSRCYYVLLAIAKHESGFRETAVGDGGQSHGAYQIYRKAHPEVSVEQAKDFDFAVSWTLNRMIGYGFPKDEVRAVWAHNGIVPGLNESYYRNVLATADRFEREKL